MRTRADARPTSWLCACQNAMTAGRGSACATRALFTGRSVACGACRHSGSPRPVLVPRAIVSAKRAGFGWAIQAVRAVWDGRVYLQDDLTEAEPAQRRAALGLLGVC